MISKRSSRDGPARFDIVVVDIVELWWMDRTMRRDIVVASGRREHSVRRSDKEDRIVSRLSTATTNATKTSQSTDTHRNDFDCPFQRILAVGGSGETHRHDGNSM